MKIIYSIITSFLFLFFSLNATAQCIRGNCVNGYGTLAFPDGENYVGEFKYGKKHGNGTYTWADGSKYIGEDEENNATIGTDYDKYGNIIK